MECSFQPTLSFLPAKRTKSLSFLKYEIRSGSEANAIKLAWISSDDQIYVVDFGILWKSNEILHKRKWYFLSRRYVPLPLAFIFPTYYTTILNITQWYTGDLHREIAIQMPSIIIKLIILNFKIETSTSINNFRLSGRFCVISEDFFPVPMFIEKGRCSGKSGPVAFLNIH